MQSELNKSLYEAIRKSEFMEGNMYPNAATACEKIVLQEKIDLLKKLKAAGRTNGKTYQAMIDSLTEQLNNL